VSPFGLIARARSDTDRLKTALESFGYYESHVTTSTINGLLLTDPSLGDALTWRCQLAAAREGHGQLCLGARFTILPPDLEHRRRLVPAPINAHETLGPDSGQPAVCRQRADRGGATCFRRCQEQGYAFARVDAPVAYDGSRYPGASI